MFDWHDYDKIRLVQPPPASLRHEHVLRCLDELSSLNPTGMRLETVGVSYEDREIRCATVGWGVTTVLAWSQMHGNEPTHTAVLLDLLHFLQRFPDHDTAHTILKGCTLHCVPMLNPDGAERYTRRNAQEIDVNRDALQLQTPEGRILHDLVQRLRPQFAFNLHNQNRLTSAGGAQKRPATISLLVPPVDADDSQTLETIRAKQVAARFLAALPSEYQDMITRYDADFMPRCFGEWVQQQATSTVTVEAGGWPNGDPGPLGQAHFAGLVRALESIADGSYLDADPADYDNLPRSSEHNLFDLLISELRVVDAARSKSCVMDLGINQQIDVVDPQRIHRGWIEDLGDLSVTGGITNLDGSGYCCTPGRFVFLERVTPLNLPDEVEVSALLSTGVTTVIGVVDLSQGRALEQLAAWGCGARFPVNLGFVGRLGGGPPAEAGLAGGGLVLGVLGESCESASALNDYLGVPVFSLGELRAQGESGNLAKLLGFTDHARIGLRAAADLVLRRNCVPQCDITNELTGEADKVLIAGGIAFEQNEVKKRDLGRLLTSAARTI